MTMKDKDIVVWFSCGAASAVAAKLTLDYYGRDNRVIDDNNPIKEEDKDNRRFLRDVQKWLGVKIQFAVNSKFNKASAEEVWKQRKAMAFTWGAPCTQELKKKAREQWERERNNNCDYTVLGFTYDEKDRADLFTDREPLVNLLPILVDKKITKQDCFQILAHAGIEIPRVYRMGFPNANCIGCCKATSPTYWNLVRKEYPQVFDDRMKLSRELNRPLVRIKGELRFLDELSPDDRGNHLERFDFECGLFCPTTLL